MRDDLTALHDRLRRYTWHQTLRLTKPACVMPAATEMSGDS